MEIVVEHEIEAFLFRGGEEEEEIDDLSILSIFEDLIAEKWNKFGRAFHIIWVMLPHVLVLLAYLFLLTVRVPAIYERQHIGYKFPNVITGGLGYNNQLYDSANQNWVCPVFFCLGIPFLLFQAYLEALRGVPRSASKQTVDVLGAPVTYAEYRISRLRDALKATLFMLPTCRLRLMLS